MSDADGDAPAHAPAALAADVGYMDLNQPLQDVQKTALIRDGLCRGLKQATKALDRRQAHLCVLANSVDEPSCVELIEAGYAEHGINLLKVDDDAKQLGEWAGLCKLDGEGKAGQVNACGVVVVKDPGMETPALDVARDYFKSNFLHDRMQRDGLENAPGLDQMQEPDNPKGPPMEHVREIARALKCIGDDLDRDQKLQEQATKVPPEAERPTLLNVAANIFEDGIFTWGPVVALFYFAYKLCVKALDRIPLVRAVINLIVEFMRGRVLQWILERGRREANREYFGSSGKRFALVIGAGVAACAGVLLYRNYLC